MPDAEHAVFADNIRRGNLPVSVVVNMKVEKEVDQRTLQPGSPACIEHKSAPAQLGAPGEIRELLVRQVLSPVLWEDSVRNMLAAGAGKFYEIGPGKVLKGLLKRIDRKVECQSVNDS